MSTYRHPHEIYLAAVSIVSGSAFLAGISSGALDKAVSPTLANVWAVMLIITGTVTLIGNTIRDRLNGMLLEFIAQLPMGLLAVAYGFALVFFIDREHAALTLPISLVFGYGIACISRSIQIIFRLRELRSEVRAHGRRK